MNRGVLVLGCDPALANFGWALVRLLPRGEEVVAMGVIRTEASDKKVNVLVADDTFRRARQVGTALQHVTERHGAVRAVCYEGLSLPRNASAAAKIGFAFGVLAGAAVQGTWPACGVSPQALKKAVTGSGSATKNAVAEALGRYFGLCAWAPNGRTPKMLCTGPDPLVGVPIGYHEHAWDALGAVVACLGSDVIRALRPVE